MNFEAGKYLVGESEIVCPYCDKLNGKGISYLSWKHLTIHNKTLEDVRKEFPDLVTMTLDYYENQKSKASGTKTVQCKFHNDDDCSKETIVVKKSAAKYYLCDKCKAAGKILDKRSSKEAQLNREKTLESKYGEGIKNPNQVPGSTDRAKETYKKMGRKQGYADEEYARKSRETMQKNYDTNVTNVMHIKEIAEKVGQKVTKEANPERGNKISEALKGQESKLKDRTYQEIHGEERANQLLEKKRQVNLDKFIKNDFPLLLDYFDFEFIDEKYLGAHIFHNFKCTKCGLIMNKD